MDGEECPCPACGFYSSGQGFFGSYSVCPICNWEDDGVQLANPACGGGANKDSLIDAQVRVMKSLPLEVQEHGGYRRDPRWRPLNEEEIRSAEREKNERRWMRQAVFSYSEAYWVKNN